MTEAGGAQPPLEGVPARVRPALETGDGQAGESGADPRTPRTTRVLSRSRRRPWTEWIALALLGAALGVSQLVYGAYNEATWAPIALGALALMLALAIGSWRRLPLLALIPLLGLWLWSLISSGWSDSVDLSHIAADRWLLYAAGLAVLWWVVGEDRRRAIALLTGASAGVLGVAAWILVRMLDGHAAGLFLGTRLNDPLGYVDGQAGYLLVGLWPCLALAECPARLGPALAERRASPAAGLVAGAGIGGLVVLLGIGLLTQSRSWGLALIGVTLLLLLAIPGRRRRVAAVLLVGAAVASIYPSVADVWRHPTHATGVPTNAATSHAAVTILVAAVAAGVVWGVAVLALERLAPGGSRSRARMLRVTSAAIVALVLAVAAVIAVNAGAIGHRIHTQYQAFVHLSSSSGGTRLFSGAGNRYDYWRIALTEFRSEPLHGVGAGNYDVGYYLHRRTTEDITQPHSLELQTLAELGIVGALLLLAFLGTVAVGLSRTARAANHDPLARAVAIAGGGTFAAWLIQTSVDWEFLFPGLTAIALAGAVALLRRPDSRSAALRGRAHVAAIVAAAVIAIAGAVTIVPRVLSLHEQTSAQRALADGAPRAAIQDATRALDYDPNSVEALILRSAGFARLDAFAPALANLRQAIAVEPKNWTTWALLGDLFTRRGERRKALAAYTHALSLDPREPSLQSAVSADASGARAVGSG